ncbi:MAG: glycosyltransferase [Chloroflexia bacterium]
MYPPIRLQGLRPLAAGEEDEGTILSVARLDAAKRVELLIEAVARAKSPVRARLIGTGPDEAKLRRLAQERGVADRVEFLGGVSDEEVVRRYNACRAVYYAPVDEDYGYATVEAFTAGRPVLTATDAGAIREFVRDEETGAVVPPEPGAFAAVLDRWFEDGAGARKLGEAGRGVVREITWDKVVGALTR